MNKKLLIILLLSFASAVSAQTDKSKYCPDVSTLKVDQSGPYFRVNGLNADGKSFHSKPFSICAYCSATFKLINRNDQYTDYNESKKELACAYNGTFSVETKVNIDKVVIVTNTGDY